jgi:hypothetical protein
MKAWPGGSRMVRAQLGPRRTTSDEEYGHVECIAIGKRRFELRRMPLDTDGTPLNNGTIVMADSASPQFFVSGDYQPLMRMLGLDAGTVFEHPDIRCWRKLPDRENCTLDVDLPDGRHVRLHVKRYVSAADAQPEVDGHELLVAASIPTAPLVGWGTSGGRSFVIFDDLTGYAPGDKLVERGTAFETLLEPTADLAAVLHAAGLHHRDLYLCHFMARLIGQRAEVKLIDTARVRRLSGLITRGRWIVKDLAQFWYSTLKLPVTEDQRSRWLERYASRAGTSPASLRRRIERKVRSIARHDARLHRDRPERDVSLPGTGTL